MKNKCDDFASVTALLKKHPAKRKKRVGLSVDPNLTKKEVDLILRRLVELDKK